MTYGIEPPRDLKPDWLELVALCSAADGAGSKLPTTHLDRWRAVFESIKDWYHTGDSMDSIEERHYAWMDPVQRDIVRPLVLTYMRLLPRRPTEEFNFDPSPCTVPHPLENVRLRASVQAIASSPDGEQIVKIKTGRSAISDSEAAVLLSDLPIEAELLEVSLTVGEMRQVTMDDDERRATISRLFGIWDAHSSVARKTRIPGRQCLICPRPARCGQYPIAGGGRVSIGTRTVLVSKSWLERLSRCHRQVAWKAIYGIPEDTRIDVGEANRARTTGSDFHEAMAAALLASDPSAAFDRSIQVAPISDQQALRLLFERHQSLTSSESWRFDPRLVEYDLGATFVVRGIDVDSSDRVQRDAEVAVVLTARADAVGRERDGTPVVLENRTGEVSSQTYLETDLYALGCALLTGSEQSVVHIHRLGLPDGPSCERVQYELADLQAAVARLREAAETIARWHPQNALEPAHTVGTWCEWCPFRERCELYRT